MQEFETKPRPTEVLVRTFCNSCGIIVEPNPCSDISSHIAVIFATWGYGSGKDGEDHTLHICELCYDKFVDKCVLKPTIDGLKGMING